MTTDEREYPSGILVRAISRFDCNQKIINVGDIVEIKYSDKYKGNYDFVGYDEMGWLPKYVEAHTELVKIDNWKKIFGGI